MDCSTPGFTVHHQLLEFTQTHVHWVSDAIQWSHPLSSPSPFNLAEHQGLFQWVSSSHQVAKVLASLASVIPMSIQDWSPLGWTGLTSLQSKGLSGIFSNNYNSKASVLPMYIEGWFPLELTDRISLLCKQLSRVFSSITVWMHPFLSLTLLYDLTLISLHDYWKNHSFD